MWVSIQNAELGRAAASAPAEAAFYNSTFKL